MNTEELNKLGNLVLQNVQISLCVVDKRGVVVYANQQAEDFLGSKRENMLGKHIHDVVHGNSKTVHKKDNCPLLKPFESGEPILREPDLFYKQSGEGYWTEYSAYPLKKEENLNHVLISFLDASVSMKSKETLNNHQAKFKAVFVQALYPKLILDSTGEILEANPAAKKILGEKIENTLLFDCFASQSQKRLKKLWNEVMQGEVTEERVELSVNGSATSKRRYFMDISVSKNIQPNMHLLTLVDVTKEVLRLEAQSKFISVASHELKTPLAVIRAYSELLERKYKEDASAKSYVSKIKSKVDILTQLINAMVDEIKLGTGKLEFNNQKLDFDEYLLGLVTKLQQTCHHNNLIVQGTANAKLNIDPERIGQIISNLISNASKYSPKGKDIIIQISSDNREVLVGVKDYGSGITKADQASLFKAFYRSPSAEKKKYPGLGLGLFISKQIVNHYGGDMWVESKWKKGSTFYFTLPRK